MHAGGALLANRFIMARDCIRCRMCTAHGATFENSAIGEVVLQCLTPNTGYGVRCPTLLVMYSPGEIGTGKCRLHTYTVSDEVVPASTSADQISRAFAPFKLP